MKLTDDVHEIARRHI